MSTTLLGKYEIERELGRGGMGYVVLARHLELDERVAIKFLLPAYANHQELVARFLREARAAVKIKSEHVGRARRQPRRGRSPYMVMEFLRGRDLGKHSNSADRCRSPRPWSTCSRPARRSRAHALGIIHRDLKPANMFLTHRVDGTPRVKVLDFGISKLGSNTKSGLTQTHGLMGSPLYMSPEQYRSRKDVDVPLGHLRARGGTIRADLAAVAGPRRDRREPHVQGAARAAAPITAARPDVPPGLAAVIHRALD
ncbi:MAG: serine/threonine protein kinase, partial [Myxococcales bacterium]|nr:serine/threonine protein kinase [Myxococcales bacterium]